jgi:membrane-bound lytic murein transglycosylase D
MRATFPPTPANSIALSLLLCLAVILVLTGCQAQGTRDEAPEPEVRESVAERPKAAPPARTVRTVRVPRATQPSTPDAPQGDLWADIRATFVMDHAVDHRRVQQELRWLRSHPNYLVRLQDRLQRYLPYIHAEVAARNLPGELTLLPILESGLDPTAAARGGAAGLWQFVPATADRFGLPKDRWIDGRRDPVMSTNAALDYLEHLHDDLQDWHMALAAYNLGEGTIRRAAQHGAKSFWELRLPESSLGFVPRLMALAAIVAEPDKYRMEMPAIANELTFVTVETEGPFDLVRAAAALGVEVDALYGWNPALNQWATPPQGPHQLHVPASVADTAQESLGAVPAEERVQWLRVKIDKGETLSAIARRFRTDVTTLRSVNRLSSDHVRAGQVITIPQAHSIPGSALANGGRSSGSAGAISYAVKPGDSLWTIARAHGSTVAAIAQANGLGPNPVLQIGQRLVVPGSDATDSHTGAQASSATVSGSGADRPEVKRVRYGVRRGDSLSRIARRFNVAVDDIIAWNRLDVNSYLQPGQSLLILVANGAD